MFASSSEDIETGLLKSSRRVQFAPLPDRNSPSEHEEEDHYFLEEDKSSLWCSKEEFGDAKKSAYAHAARVNYAVANLPRRLSVDYQKIRDLLKLVEEAASEKEDNQNVDKLEQIDKDKMNKFYELCTWTSLAQSQRGLECLIFQELSSLNKLQRGRQLTSVGEAQKYLKEEVPFAADADFKWDWIAATLKPYSQQHKIIARMKGEADAFAAGSSTCKKLQWKNMVDDY